MKNTSFDFNDLVLGTDLIYIPRLQKAFTRHQHSFFKKMLTTRELEQCFSSSLKEDIAIRRAAGKIAVKEAVSKALGSGLNGIGWSQGVSWQEIEVISKQQQPPQLQLHAKALSYANKLDIQEWRISLSHDGDYATATAIGLIHHPDF